jgi:hypothetical protein
MHLIFRALDALPNAIIPMGCAAFAWFGGRATGRRQERERAKEPAPHGARREGSG